MKKWDFIIIACAIMVAGGLYFSGILKSSTPGGNAVIYVDGEKEVTLSLLKNQTYTVETENGYNIIEINQGQATVVDANCRDKICVNHKAVSLVKESITCLPHKMIVEIQGTTESKVDSIVQ